MSDKAVLSELGSRVRQERLNQNTTQHALALHAGVALNVVRRLEGEYGCTLGALIKVLRALGKLDQLDSFLPEPGLSPILMARAQRRQRVQATGGRGRRREKPENSV
jgi:predicted transcriptional regulator